MVQAGVTVLQRHCINVSLASAITTCIVGSFIIILPTRDYFTGTWKCLYAYCSQTLNALRLSGFLSILCTYMYRLFLYHSTWRFCKSATTLGLGLKKDLDQVHVVFNRCTSVTEVSSPYLRYVLVFTPCMQVVN